MPDTVKAIGLLTAAIVIMAAIQCAVLIFCVGYVVESVKEGVSPCECSCPPCEPMSISYGFEAHGGGATICCDGCTRDAFGDPVCATAEDL